MKHLIHVLCGVCVLFALSGFSSSAATLFRVSFGFTSVAGGSAFNLRADRSLDSGYYTYTVNSHNITSSSGSFGFTSVDGAVSQSGYFFLPSLNVPSYSVSVTPTYIYLFESPLFVGFSGLEPLTSYSGYAVVFLNGLPNSVNFLPSSSNSYVSYYNNQYIVSIFFDNVISDSSGFLNVYGGTFSFVSDNSTLSVNVDQSTFSSPQFSVFLSNLDTIDNNVSNILDILSSLDVSSFEETAEGATAQTTVNSTTSNIENYEDSVFQANSAAITASGLTSFSFGSFANGFSLVASVTNGLYDRLPSSFKLLIQALLLIGASALVLNVAGRVLSSSRRRGG